MSTCRELTCPHHGEANRARRRELLDQATADSLDTYNQPADTTHWQPLGYLLADDDLQHDDPVGPLILDDPPPRPVGAAYAAAVANRAALTWRSHQLLLSTSHPAALRTKTEYHRRRR